MRIFPSPKIALSNSYEKHTLITKKILEFKNLFLLSCQCLRLNSKIIKPALLLVDIQLWIRTDMTNFKTISASFLAHLSNKWNRHGQPYGWAMPMFETVYTYNNFCHTFISAIGNNNSRMTP